MKIKPTPKRRVRGKLSKKEQIEMKKRDKDIGWMLAPPLHQPGRPSSMRRP